MYKRILVPVDGSTFSEQLIVPAAAVAAHTGAELALLRVVDKAEDQEASARYVEELAKRVGATSLTAPAPAGGVAAAICDEARRQPETLVAICSHGRSGAMQAIFGSVALQVLHGLGAPLVVFRPRPDGAGVPTKVSRIVLPLDGSAVSESIVPQAAGLAKWLDTRVLVVSVIDQKAALDASIPAGDLLESGYVHARAREISDRYGVAASWEVLHGDPKQAIPQFVTSLGDTMLAMTTHGRTGLRSVVTGSVMAQCLRDAGVPVFTRLP